MNSQESYNCGYGYGIVQSLNQCVSSGFLLMNRMTLGNILNLLEQFQFSPLRSGNDSTFLAGWLN